MPRDPQSALKSGSSAQMPNLGPKSTLRLAAVGVDSVAALRRRGALATYIALKRRFPNVTLNMLYGLMGALDGTDWKLVKRERKLALLIEVEDYERRHPARGDRVHDELLALRNVGPAMRRDFELLGIRSVAQLAQCDADKLYARLQKLTGTRHDPCVWDTFAAAIHQARNGEALPWWQFTRLRKRREAEGSFMRRTAPRKIGT